MKLTVKNFYVKSTIFTSLSLVAAACSYALYPALVRILPSSDFGDFAVTSAALNQVLAVLLTINIISIYLVKQYGEQGSRIRTQTIQKALLWSFSALCLLLILAWPLLQNIFKIEHPLIFIPLIFVLLLNIPLVVWNGYLQGNKELVRIGLGTLGASLAKLVFAITLGLLMGATGSMFGLLIGTLVGLAVLYLYPGVRPPGLETVTKKMSKSELATLSKLKFYIVQVAVVVGALGILQNYDISLEKILFDPNTAGTYSSVGILSTALYYLAFILVWIILPEISITNNTINRRVLATAYRLYACLAIIAIVSILLFGDQLLTILLGASFNGKADLLLFGALYQLTLVSVVLYAYSLLVRHKRRALLLVGLSFTFCLTLPLFIGHSDPLSMIRSLWISISLGVIVYAIAMTLYSLKSRPQKSPV